MSRRVVLREEFGFLFLVNSGIFPSNSFSRGQKVEASQLSIDGWTDKQNVAYTHNGILFSLEKRRKF